MGADSIITEDEAVSLFLSPATIDGNHNKVFCIGPYGDKVGFGSQQRRALNFVWALDKSNKISDGTHVAVVGGGVAGLMACAALKGKGCIVELFEAGETVLHRQRNTRHRIVHPSINAWPLKDIPLRSSTNHPFFDWFLGRCDTVIEKLFTQWEKIDKKVLSHFHEQCRVLNIEGKSDRVDISYTDESFGPDPTGANAKTESFEVVVIATGFGEEHFVKDSEGCSYWAKGNIRTVRRDPEIKSIAVSGTGDGGLIDCLRLVHNHFNRGELPLKVISDIRPPEHGPGKKHSLSTIEKMIIEAEKKAKTLFEDSADPSGKSAEEVADAISVSLFESYTRIFHKLDSEIKGYLDDSIRNYKRVRLYGLLKQPFSRETAPINKLLLAHLISKHPNLYIQGRIFEVEGKEGLFWKKIGPNQRRKKFSHDYYVCRHGALAPINRIVTGFDATRYKGRYAMIADIMGGVSFPHNEFTAALRDCRENDPEEPAFIADRVPMANEFCYEYYDETPAAAFDRTKKEPRFLVDNTPSYILSRQRTGGLDDQLFGVDIKLRKALPNGVSSITLEVIE